VKQKGLRCAGHVAQIGRTRNTYRILETYEEVVR